MYVVGLVNDTVYQYTLSTAWDISTASYSSKSFSVASQDTFPTSIQFKSDGTKMFMVGQQTSNVRQYSLSSAWDVSTASYDSVSFSVGTQVGGSNVNFLFFSADGTKMYAGGSTNQTIFQYSLSSAWDLSTASYASKSFSVASQEGDPRGIFFKSDGSVLFVVGINDDEVLQYSLSTSWDVSTASFDNISFSVASQDSTPVDVHFSSDGEKMFISGVANQSVYQYSTAQVDYPTASPVTITGLTNGTSYTFNVWAINAFGWSSPSDASEAVSPVADVAVFMGGSFGSSPYVSSVIDYVNISTTGSASNWGSLTVARGGAAPASNSTRGIAAAGGNIYITQIRNTIDYITFASTGNAVDFGDTTVARYYRVGGISNDTRGIFISGRVAGPNASQTTDYVTIATTGNATDYGNYGINLREGPSGCSSTTRGVSCGGLSETNVQYNDIRYTTIATVGSYSDFGDLTQTSYRQGAASNGTRGIFSGVASSNVIEYVTIASTGNATDFGDLTVSQAYHEATSNKTRAIMAMSNGGTAMSLDYVNIATTGNASDFGSLSTNRYQPAAVGNNHGGVS